MKRIEKIMKVQFPLWLILFSSLATSNLLAQEERRFIRKGTEQYNQGKYLESENEYWKALDKNNNSFEARFNVAATMFKQEKYQDAIKQLQALSAQTTDKDKLSKIYHNIGNSFLGLKEIDKGIDAYKTALKNNPFDDETRYNLIAAMKMKEQNEQEQEQEQEQQQQEQEQDQQEQNQQQQEQQEGISRENAERILQAMEQDEKQLQEKMKKQKEAQPVSIDKNW